MKSFGWFISPGRIHIAMEYCELGDLEKYLSKSPLHRVSEAEAHDISSQILDALCSMHEEKYCHRDLKLAVGFHLFNPKPHILFSPGTF